jgi:uncharacterized protein
MKQAISACLLASAALLSAPSQALEPSAAGETPLSPHVTSVRELRDAGVVKQRYDYSCGAAALATLLTYGMADPVGEETLVIDLLQIISAEDQGTVKRQGFSLLDLQQLAQRRGHAAQGFRVSAAQLARLRHPVIVFVQAHGYRHFTVLKGVRDNRAFLADPSLGNVRMPLYRFLDMWADASGRGVVFAVEPKGAWPEASPLDTPERPVNLEAFTARRFHETAPPWQADHGIR